MRQLLEHRAWASAVVAAAVGLVARTLLPWRADDPILVNRLSEQVRQQIQTIIDGRLARRRSIWFG